MMTDRSNQNQNHIHNHKRIGILGGTFNPIHFGHLHLAQKAFEAASLDQVLFVPSGVSYMKNQKEIVPARDRMAMTELATADTPWFAVSPIEIEKEGNSYSFETIHALQKQQPLARFFFITGADTVFAIEDWKEPEQIFRSVTILAAYRTGVSLDELKHKMAQLERSYHADIRLIAADHIDISSSQIRRAIQEGRTVREWIPQAVEQYIREHHFYENGHATE